MASIASLVPSSKKGAQNEEYIHRPDYEMFNRLDQASGNCVKLLDIAPEEEVPPALFHRPPQRR